MINEVVYAFRSVRRSPGFAAFTLLTLGVGLGLSTAAVAIVDACLFPQTGAPAGLYRVSVVKDDGSRGIPLFPVFDAVRQQGDIVQAAASQFTVETYLEDYIARGQAVSDQFYRVLGGRPALGEMRAGPRDLVLSYRAWEVLFSRDPAIVGKELRVGVRRYTVAGVASQNFSGFDASPYDFWVSMDSWNPDRLNKTYVEGAVQLRHGITARQAEIALSAFIHPAGGEANRGVGIVLRSLGERPPLASQARDEAVPLIAVLVLTLLSPCVTIASMIVARHSARQKELGVRVAIGASSAAIARVVLWEAGVLGLLGGVLAIPICRLTVTWGMKTLFSSVPLAASPLLRTTIPIVLTDSRVLGLTILLSLATALAVGAGPALAASRNPATALVATGTPRSMKTRWRQITLFGQIAFSTILLLGSFLLIRSGERVRRTETGYDLGNVYTFSPPAELETAARVLREKSWVEAAATATDARTSEVGTEGGAPMDALCTSISSSYFDVLRIAVLLGSTKADVLEEGEIGVLVSAKTAEALWHGGNAIGRKLHVRTEPAVFPLQRAPVQEGRVVGVVADVATAGGPSGLDPAHVYLLGNPAHRRERLLVRTRGLDAAKSIGELRNSLSGIARPEGVLVFAVGDRAALDSYAPVMLANLAVGLGGVSFIQAAAGIYSLLLCLLGNRRKELAIRVAIGAPPFRLWLAIIRPVLVLAVLGTGIGTALALAAIQLVVFRPQADVNPGNIIGGAAVCGLLILVLTGVTGIPVWRASFWDTSKELR